MEVGFVLGSGGTAVRKRDGGLSLSRRRVGVRMGEKDDDNSSAYRAFDKLLGGNQGRKSDKGGDRKLPPRNGFAAPERPLAGPEEPEESVEDQYKIFEDFLSGKPDALKKNPGAEAPDRPALSKPVPRSGSSASSPPPRAAIPPPTPFGTPPPPRMAPPPSRNNLEKPSYSRFDQLLSQEDAMKWSREKERALPLPTGPEPSFHIGDSLAIDELRSFGVFDDRSLASADLVVCVTAPSGQALTGTWMNLIAEIGARATIDRALVVGIAATETQKALDRLKKKKSLRMALYADESRLWMTRLGPKRTNLWQANRTPGEPISFTLRRVWLDPQPGQGHAEELVEEMKKLLNQPAPQAMKPGLNAPYGSKQAAAPAPKVAQKEEERPAVAPGPVPVLRSPFAGKYEAGDIVSTNMFDDVKSDLLVASLAPAGTPTQEWVRLLAECSSRALLPGVEFRAVYAKHGESLGKLLKKQKVSFPFVSDETEDFFHEFGHKCTYLFEVTGREVEEEGGAPYELKVLKRWGDVGPGIGHAEELVTELKARMKARETEVGQKEVLRSPVTRQIPVEEVSPPKVEEKVEEPVPEEPQELMAPPAHLKQKGQEAALDAVMDAAVDMAGEAVVEELDEETSESIPELGEEEEHVELPEIMSAPVRRKMEERRAGLAEAILALNRKEMKKRPRSLKSRDNGKLVVNHSSNIRGLLRVLDRLCDNEVRVTIKTDKGFKMIARHASSVQEIFVVTTLSRKDLIELVVDTFKFFKGKSRGRESYYQSSDEGSTVQELGDLSSLDSGSELSEDGGDSSESSSS